MAIVREITPDVSLFGKLGARSRAFPMVVTELVDNSLDSWISLPSGERRGKKLQVEISAKVGKDAWFVIKDNAGGMTQEELIDAMTVAKSAKQDDNRFIGHFGLGLKSAAMYIGSKFRVFSLSGGQKKTVNFVEFDREKFENSKEWKLKFDQMSVDEAAKIGIYFPDGHGTEIQIRNERYRPGNKESILNRLRRVFGPRLPKNPKLKLDTDEFAEDMVITFNEETVLAAGPFYEVWDNSAKKVEEQTEEFLKQVKRNPREISNLSTDYIKGEQVEAAILPSKIKWLEDIPAVVTIPEIKINDKKVSGRVGILDRGMAHNNKYGFDLVKNGRVIEENVLDRDLKDRDIGLMASNHNARIAGQLFLDDWKTDHQKTSFLKDTDDFVKLIDHVSKYTKNLLHISSLLQNPNKYFRENLNIRDDNAPEVIAEKKFEDKIPDIEKGVQQAVRSSTVKTTLNSLEKNRATERAKFEKIQKKVEPESTTKLIFTKPIIKYGRKGDDAKMVFTKVVKEKSNNILEITLNRDHPFLYRRESAELAAIGEFLAIDYFASYILNNKEDLTHDDFIQLRDELLKELSLKK